MNTTYLKLIIGGILLGTAVYFVPFFFLKVIGFFLIFGLIAWLFKGRRRHHYMAWADHVRNMSDDEFKTWKEKGGRHCGPRSGYEEAKTVDE